MTYTHEQDKTPPPCPEYFGYDKPTCKGDKVICENCLYREHPTNETEPIFYYKGDTNRD